MRILSSPGVFERLPAAKNRRSEGGLRLSGNLKESQDGVPLVSVVTVVLNNAQTVKRCIDSVAKQTYSNIEHIVIDGGSTDGTLSIIEDYAGAIDYFVSEPDSGIYNAMNKGVLLARGEYLAMINSDDWLVADGVEQSVAALQGSGDDFSIGHANVLDGDNRFMHTWTIGNFDDRTLLSGMSFCHQAMFASRQCYEDVGLYDERLAISADYKWVKSLFQANKSAVFLRKPVVNFSYSGLTVTHREQWKTEAENLLLESFPHLEKAQANYLVEFVYRDGPLPDLVYDLLKDSRTEPQFLVSISMFLAQRAIEAEAALQIGQEPRIKELASMLSRRLFRKLLGRGRS